MRGEIQTFHVLPIDHALLGLDWRNWEDNDYFCTPRGAEIIGSPDMDGIHFVMIPNDKRIFCVNPVAEPSSYVVPVAESFLDFISYLLYCRESLPIARIREMPNEKAFRTMLAEEAALTWPGSEVYYQKKKKSLRTLAAAYGAQPEDPYMRIRRMQATFQMDEIEFTEEYEKALAAGQEKGVFNCE